MKNEIITLKEAFSTGTAPVGGNAKKFQKLLKNYGHLIDPKLVRLYPIRDCGYDDGSYRVFAMPVNSESIDPETLEAIKEEIDVLPLGSIRYNAGAEGSRPIEIEDVTGKYLAKEEDTDDVMTISNHFDGVVIFTMAIIGIVGRGNLEPLCCHYAVLGKWDGSGFGKWTSYEILPIENAILGKECDIDTTHFEHLADTSVNPDSAEGRVATASRKYMDIMQYVMYALIAAGVVWYFFFR